MSTPTMMGGCSMVARKLFKSRRSFSVFDRCSKSMMKTLPSQMNTVLHALTKIIVIRLRSGKKLDRDRIDRRRNQQFGISWSSLPLYYASTSNTLPKSYRCTIRLNAEECRPAADILRLYCVAAPT